MSNNWYADVSDFMEAFGQEVKKSPDIPDEETIYLRQRLITEEYEELMHALNLCLDVDTSEIDKIKLLSYIADGSLDLIVVILGTLAACGVCPQEIWDEIHLTNMAKIGGGKREDGKVLKPEGWKPPNIEKLILDQTTN